MDDPAQYFKIEGFAFKFTLCHHMPRGDWIYHSHETLEIVFHRRGKGFTRDRGGEPMGFAARQISLHPPGVEHAQTMLSKGEDICIHYAMMGHPPPWLRATTMVLPTPPLALQMALERVGRMAGVAEGLERVAFSYEALAILARLCRIAMPGKIILLTTAQRYADRANDYLNRNFGTIRSLGEIADQLGVSNDYLRHIYRTRYRQSLKRALVKVRISHAKDMLIHSGLPQKVIAVQCGFKTERYFCTCFHENAGKSPGSFRRAHARPALNVRK